MTQSARVCLPETPSSDSEEEEVGFEVVVQLKDVLFWDDGAWSRNV